MFKTDVLGLKNKKVKNTKLSFEDDLLWCFIFNFFMLFYNIQFFYDYSFKS